MDDDRQPDPPAPQREPDHTEDPREAQESDQRPETAPTRPAPGDADGGDD